MPGLFAQDDLKRRLLITLNMTKVVASLANSGPPVLVNVGPRLLV